VIRIGATRQGKTLAAARAVVEAPHEAAVILDPHRDSLAAAVLMHADDNLLYERLSDVRTTLGFELLAPSDHPDEAQRRLINHGRAEAFVEILLRRRGEASMAGSPLMEEWVTGALMLYLFQDARRPLALLPSAFLPGTAEFAALVRGCTLPDVRHKFGQLERLSPRALRAEVGSAARLVNAVFRSSAFLPRSRGGFDLGRFLQARGKLVVERGDEVGDDAMRAIMGAIVLLVIDHARRRPRPDPPIRIYIDEATNAGLVGRPELRGVAETNKTGLYWDFLVQNLDFPGGADPVLQNCHRREWFGCPFHGLARTAAIDVAGGLPPASEESRAEQVAALTADIRNLPPGWRWVCGDGGSRKEYVPLLEGWPDWPGLREAKLREKLCRIHARPEYRRPPDGESDGPPSSTSSPGTPPPPGNSPGSSSPAERLRRRGRRPAGPSSSSASGGGSG